MKQRWLQLYAIVVAACTLTLIATGTFVTTNQERPLFSIGRIHPQVAMAVGIVTTGLVFWLLCAEKRRGIRTLAWLASGSLIVEGLVGLPEPPRPLPVSFTHTSLAYMFFSAIVAIVVSTSPGRDHERQMVEERQRFSSRSLAAASSTAVVAQLLIGAAFRYGVTNVIAHILGATVVVTMSLAAGLGVKGRFPGHLALRRTSNALIGVTLAQVFLGAVVLSIQLINPDDPLPVMLAISTHAASAALTAAVNVVFAIQVCRLVRNNVDKASESRATSKTA